jgi:selenocysteine lyase/cysteine desulfurase
MTVLREYDHVLSAAILRELETLPGVQIHGITDRSRLAERVPTVSFTREGRHPREIAAALGEQGIFVWDGNYYALAVTERLGLKAKVGWCALGRCTITRFKRSNGSGMRCVRLCLARRSIGLFPIGSHGPPWYSHNVASLRVLAVPPACRRKSLREILQGGG